MARKVRVRVDHNLCVGNSMCETFAPHVFRLNDDRQSAAVDPDGDPIEQILEAAESCPMSAILVEDAETGEQLCPEPPKGASCRIRLALPRIRHTGAGRYPRPG